MPTCERDMEGTKKNMELNPKSFANVWRWLLDSIPAASDFHSIILAIIIWHIWENRNNTLNGEVLCHRVMGKIKAYIEYITLHNASSSNSNRHETSPSIQKWSPPREAAVLMNFDATTFAQ